MVKWHENKTFGIVGALAFLVILSYSLVPGLAAFRHHLGLYVRTVWWAILGGLFLSGLLEYFIPQAYISRMLSPPKKRTILYSVMLGFLMSACSCGILVLSMQLYKKGASTPAVVAFLLASPWANLPLTLMFIGFFGFFRAVYIVAVAVVIALATGFIFQVLESRNLIERNKNSLGVDEGFSIIKDIQRRCANYQFSFKKFPQAMKGILQNTREISDRVMWWILIGVGLASLAGAYIPQDIFQRHMGPTLAGLMVTLGLATVMEVCSEGTSPVAFEIFRQTGALGNSFAFLMGGVVTDYTEIGLIWQNIGKKTALWLPLVTIPQVIVFAMLANRIF